MSNPYFGLVNRFEPETTVRSAAVNDAFDAVAAGFDMLPTPDETNHGKINIGVDSGTADAYVITNPDPFIAALVVNDQIRFRALHANLTTSPVLNPDGRGNIAVIRENGDACQPGDIVAEGITVCTFDGVKLRVAGASAADLAATTAQAAAAAASAAASLASANNAASAQAAAAASAVQAAAMAASLYGTSASSVLIATGAKTFTTEAGKTWPVAAFVAVASRANPANYMFGQVTSYSGTTLILNVSAIGGAGTFADWNVSLAGARGADGPVGPVGSGAGDVTGPGVAVSGRVVTFSGTTGKIIQDSGVTLGNVASQAKSAIDITGGTIVGITDLAVADGGTGGSSAATARTNLGVAIGTDVQAYSAKTAALAALAWAADKLVLLTGTATCAILSCAAFMQTFLAAADAAAARTALGITAGQGSPYVPDDLVGYASGTVAGFYVGSASGVGELGGGRLILTNAANETISELLGVADTTPGGRVEMGSAAGNGVSGIDTGTQANNNWYYVWAIRKTTPVVAGAVTADATTDRVTETGSARGNGEPITIAASVLPGGLSANTIYYTRDVSGDNYKLTDVPGQAAINITSAGTTVTVTDRVALVYSLSSYPSGLTLPAGYTYRCRIAALRSTSITAFRTMLFLGRWALFDAQTAMSSKAVASTGTFEFLSVATIVAPIARKIKGSAGQNTGAASAYSISLVGSWAGIQLGSVDIICPGISATASKMGLIKGAPFEISTFAGSLYWTCNLTGAFNAIYITGFELP